jgi:chemotaxis regulatin CheY-phosphate phosphatase CheZ
MTRTRKTRKSRRHSARNQQTNVVIDERLRQSLGNLLAGRNRQALGAITEIALRIRAEFDPSTVTMTTTNIPDAIIKLSSVLNDTNKATCRVFELIELQRRLLAENDSVVRAMIAAASDSERAEALLQSYNSNRQEIVELMNEALIAHEFQDVCGQNISKVIKLISSMETEIREIFRRLGCEIPLYDKSQEPGDSVSQRETDNILRDFGL